MGGGALERGKATVTSLLRLVCPVQDIDAHIFKINVFLQPF